MQNKQELRGLMNFDKTILITGGAGFIGSHLILRMVQQAHYRIINLDKLTYAANLNNLKAVENAPNYFFVQADIVNKEAVDTVFKKYEITDVIHLAAESHVDRSIASPDEFIYTNIVGTLNLLNAAVKGFEAGKFNKFYHVSTDEVYGSLGSEGFFTENTAYDPRSPYSASKASSDHLVRAYYHTYKLPIVISNCSNNYGPHQYPEKMIPVMIHAILNNKPLPVYGKGENIRDWLWVEDHAAAIDTLFHNGKNGETYNIGGNNEWKNIDLVLLLCRLMDEELRRQDGESAKLISYVEDRKGHDLRYAIDASKIKNELGWIPTKPFEQGLRDTIKWYLKLFQQN